MTKDYLKMADVFPCQVEPERFNYALCSRKAKCAAHAINSHDGLVAEVERLCGVISAVISTAEELSGKIATTEHGSGYIECAKDTAQALKEMMK